MARSLALGLALVALSAVLAPVIVAPTAEAHHICQPCEPAWSCEHRDPRLGDVPPLLACYLDGFVL